MQPPLRIHSNNSNKPPDNSQSVTGMVAVSTKPNALLANHNLNLVSRSLSTKKRCHLLWRGPSSSSRCCVVHHRGQVYNIDVLHVVKHCDLLSCFVDHCHKVELCVPRNHRQLAFLAAKDILSYNHEILGLWYHWHVHRHLDVLCQLDLLFSQHSIVSVAGVRDSREG